VGPLPYLDEGQVLVQFDCTQTGFAQRKLHVQLSSVKEFITVNKKKSTFQR
jgi:hypothetical protein